MLACPIALECLYAIAGRNPEVFEAPGCMKIKQFAAGDALYRLETEHLLISKQQFSIAAMERPDQTPLYYAYGIP